MSNIILNILCEGATEESFVKKVLTPYMKPFGLILKVRQLTTNRKKDIRGGVSSYQRAKNDFILWVKENSNDTYCTHYYTCMFDYYQLPTDFPGFPLESSDALENIKQLEHSLSIDLKFIPNFIPYIQLHEYEALVFAGLDHLITDYPEKAKSIQSLKKELEVCNNEPEKVNNNPNTAPSKRIEKALGNYNKVKSGVSVTEKVGIEQLCKLCPHFGLWIKSLQQITTVENKKDGQKSN